MSKIIVLGGGIGGYHVARGLAKRHDLTEKGVLLIDARPCLEYQPFLAEVVSGGVDSSSIKIPYSRSLGAGFLQATVTSIESKAKSICVLLPNGEEVSLAYDQLVVAMGSQTRYLPIPGIEENALGLKSVEDAEAIRSRLVGNVTEASSLPKGSSIRAKLLTFIVIGAGFSGVELFSEALWTARRLAQELGVDVEELSFHLVEASDRIVSDIPAKHSPKVVEQLELQGGWIHLNTFCESAVGSVVKLSTGEIFPAGCIVWTAGLMPAPCLANSDLPLTINGRLKCGADLRARGHAGVIEGVWGLGDCCEVPDKTGAGLPDGSCAPTAQHARRQADLLVKNIVSVLRGGGTKHYIHKNAGMVGGFGRGRGVFVSGNKRLVIGGLPAWLCHRVYHGLAMPSFESRIRIFADYFSRRNR